MKYALAIIIVLLLVGFMSYGPVLDYIASKNSDEPSEEITVSTITDNENTVAPTETEPLPEREIIAENLTIPWDIAFLPDGTLLVTERPGRVVHIGRGRTYDVDGVEHIGEGGLLGIALHPAFAENHYVYLYQTTESEGGLENRVVRYTYENDALTFDRVILGGIPGARYHDGGGIRFGPDGLLYISTGDATRESNAQNTASLAGKILRLRDDGTLPENASGSAVYSYGHRNPQGLAWDDEGRLWSTEHGRSGVQSGYDEVNLIEEGMNYGWPESEGDRVLGGTAAPKSHSGADDTWAPASALYLDGSLFFGGLQGEALYEAVLRGEEVIEIKEHFKGEYGRIRSVTLGPDGAMYITTSNRDGRGDPLSSDDTIIKLNPEQFRE